MAMSEESTSRVVDEAETEKTYVIIVHALYLASVVLGVTSLIGLVMAYVKRDGAQDWAAGHYQYAIRTFWLGLLYTTVSAVLVFVFIGIPLLFGVYIWFIVRSVIPLVKATNREPIDNPTSWWI
jgi:uncharacterized membrane protein